MFVLTDSGKAIASKATASKISKSNKGVALFLVSKTKVRKNFLITKEINRQ